jgi:hypothetical protein
MNKGTIHKLHSYRYAMHTKCNHIAYTRIISLACKGEITVLGRKTWFFNLALQNSGLLRKTPRALWVLNSYE